MRILVVYDSVFGNTKKIASTIADALGEDVTLSHVEETALEGSYDVIVVGSPTRAFQPTKPIKDFVKRLTKDQVAKIAFFDTRIDIEKVDSKMLRRMEKWFGYSNDTLEKIAAKKHIPCHPNSGAFFVLDSEGPLADDAVEDAAIWAKSIVA